VKQLSIQTHFSTIRSVISTRVKVARSFKID
jgi:hypothetical protein